MDLAPDARAHLLRLAAGTPPTGALALDAGDPEQRALIAAVLDASGKGPDRYPALHRDLDAGRSGDVGADDCTIVDMGQDTGGRATTRSWLASRGGAYISGATTFVFDAESGETLAAGAATQVGSTLVQASSTTAQARPASAEMTAVTLFHAQQAPDTPLRLGLVAARRLTPESGVSVTVTAPVPWKTKGANVLIGLCRDKQHMGDVDYAYPSAVNQDPDRLVVPFVGQAQLAYEIDAARQIAVTTQLYLTATKAMLGVRAGFPLGPGYDSRGSLLKWHYPFDDKPIDTTRSIQYEASNQANDTLTAFLFQFTVPVVGLPQWLTFTVCSKDTPNEPSFNCFQISDLKYWWHCLGEDTVVTLADGSERAIRDVDNDDSVRSGSGEAVTAVTATSRAHHDDNGGRDPAYRLLTEGGRSLLLSEAHPVITPAGPVAAANLRPGDPLLSADGEDRVRACEPEAYTGIVYNLAVAPGGGGFGCFLANGIVVGDHDAQAEHARASRHDPDYVLPRLPESHHRDYLSALADATSS